MSRKFAKLIAAGDRTALAVAQAPATFPNRVRRSVGMFGNIWRWDTRGTDMQREFVPRAVRRLGRSGALPPWFEQPRTRRQRKARARIRRVVDRAGLL